jgi:hypothetical protein
MPLVPMIGKGNQIERVNKEASHTSRFGQP